MLIFQTIKATRQTVYNRKECWPTFCSVLFNLSVDKLSTKPNIGGKLIIEMNLLIFGQAFCCIRYLLRESAIKQVSNFRVHKKMCSGGNPLIPRSRKRVLQGWGRRGEGGVRPVVHHRGRLKGVLYFIYSGGI